MSIIILIDKKIFIFHFLISATNSYKVSSLSSETLEFFSS